MPLIPATDAAVALTEAVRHRIRPEGLRPGPGPAEGVPRTEEPSAAPELPGTEEPPAARWMPRTEEPPATVGPGATAEPSTPGADTPALRPLADVLAGRRSAPAFAPVALQPALLRAVFDRAAATQPRQWPVGVHGDAGLRLLVAARRVDGLPAGLYDWPPGAVPVAPPLAPLPPGLAEDYADAPAVVLICGAGTPAAPAAAGGVLVRAGALGYAVWLAARTHGLECSVSGAGDAAARLAASRHRPGVRHLFTVAVGHPPE